MQALRRQRRQNQLQRQIGYPIVVRPSFVLGGRAMAIVYDEQSPGRIYALGG